MRFAVISHPDCLEHRPVPGHPERPERLAAAVAGAVALEGAVPVTAPEVGLGALGVSRVHDRSYLDRLESRCRSGRGFIDSADNPVGEGTWGAVVAAATCAVHGARLAGERTCEVAFVAARPPGHHAMRSRAMGFCYLNNAALAAETLAEDGPSRVAVVDFDVHHGNGTQSHFYDRGDVFYLSVHQYPAFPGTGAATETGAGAGEGMNRNFPLAPGADDETYCGALEAGLEDMLTVFEPQAWVVSAGFDAHEKDPVGACRVSADGFGRIGSAIGRAAVGTPVVVVLEGGYDLETLRESVHVFLSSLACALAP